MLPCSRKEGIRNESNCLPDDPGAYEKDFKKGFRKKCVADGEGASKHERKKMYGMPSFRFSITNPRVKRNIAKNMKLCVRLLLNRCSAWSIVNLDSLLFLHASRLLQCFSCFRFRNGM